MRRTVKLVNGFTLIEIVVGIVAFGILMALITAVFSPQVVRGTDPLFSMRAAELGQSYLEEILGKRFAENSPFGNNPPRCGETGGPNPCSALGIDPGEATGAQNTFDDVDDYNTLVNAVPRDQSGAVRSGYSSFTVTVEVSYAGAEVGLNNNDAKRIRVTIGDGRGGQYVFAAYKTNF